TWSPSPAAAGKFAASKAAAACESVPGRARLVVKAVPAVLLTPAMATRASSQAATTLQRCSKHQRASPAMGRNLRARYGRALVAPRASWSRRAPRGVVGLRARFALTRTG